MAWCSSCQAERPDNQFARNGKRLQGLCRACDAARKRRSRRKPERVKSVCEAIDRYPERCLWHAARVDYCRRKAKWRNGQWRACDLHKLPTDAPILFALKNMPQEAEARQPNCG